MVQYKLVYSFVRGLAEPIRLVFTYKDVEFEDVRLSFEDFHKVKLNYQFKKLPVLEVDGKPLPETYAILRYLAKKYGLLGKDEFEQALVDAYADMLKDFGQEIRPWVSVPAATPQDEKDKLQKEYLEPAAAKYLPIIVDIIEKSKSGFLVDSGLTWADFLFADRFYTLEQLAPGVLKPYPVLSKYMDKVYALPKVKEYVAGRAVTKV
ncbi:Nagst-1 protein [Aphelenchoides avenae]|nr:Nagst-1 protein [Aphelenchus avenae]